MAKWLVTNLLWSPSLSRYIQPGETVELDDGIAAILLDKQCIKPAVFAAALRLQGREQKQQNDKELKDGTNNC